ncbi:arsenate reductase/protein-tyrosine-phosphatase family protein [Streptosporangium canum]|uniref:arsenate reductase/protein-tyrosine-phosphatase family protein n=2 Tax=Streptosporangium canum TaxID=324952 RepID=UPI00379EF03B
MEGAPRTAEAGQSIDPMPAGHENCGHRCWREARTLPAPDDPGNGTGDPGAPGKAPDGPRGGLRGFGNGLDGTGSPGDGPGEEPRFRILYVCTGNLCRSPLAERLTRSVLGPCPALQVISAGTRAEPGRQMAERTRRVLVRLGGDPGGFVSRPLTPDLLAAADLVLTATTEHRAESVAGHLPAVTRAFTIAEFGALARAVPVGAVGRHEDPVRRARALVAEVRALRGLVQVDRPDIPDPYGRSWFAHRAAGRRIAGSLAVPLRLLTRSPASCPCACP